MTRSKDKRQYPRRARSLRFILEHDGGDYPVVSTMVSLGGAFLKASHIPPPSALVTLRERYSPANAPVTLRAEVVWTSDSPTLERPDTGLGVRFIEASTHGDPSHLEDFLTDLDPDFDGSGLRFEEGPSGAVALFRFDSLTPRTDYTQDDPAAAHFDDPHETDRADATRRDTRVRPWQAPATAPEAPRPAPALPAARPGKSVTGLFTSLFRRVGRKTQEPAGAPESTPALASGAAMADPELRVIWGALRADARLESIGAQSATLSVNPPLPAIGTAVLVKPLGLPLALADLTISAVVTARDDRGRHGTPSISLTFLRTDEAQTARILAYVEHASTRLAPPT